MLVLVEPKSGVDCPRARFMATTNRRHAGCCGVAAPADLDPLAEMALFRLAQGGQRNSKTSWCGRDLHEGVRNHDVDL